MATNRIGFSTDFVLVNNKIGIGTTNPSSTLSVSVGSSSRALDIGTDLLVSGSGAFAPRVTVASTIGAASTQKMQISAVSRDNGLLEIENYGGNQLFSVSNNQVEDAFAIYRYANYDNLSITSFENRNLFRVGPLGIVTTYGAIRVGTSNTTANSSVFNQFYGNLNIRAPFSTATEYVSIVPKFSDRGALSFEAPVGTAQTDRGTQIFSISNNLSSSIFRVNDLNRNPIFEASASGRVGIGTTNPQAKLEVQGTTRVTSVGSTAGEQIDIRHYRNIANQSQNYTGVGLTNNRGAISFDSVAGFSTNGIQVLPASLFAIINDPTGNIFSVGGYGYFSSSIGVPAIDVTQSGRVGIGTTNPQEKLHVVGNTLISGIASITSLDVASVLRVTSIGSTPFQQIEIKHITPTSIPNSPTRGSVLFEGVLEPTPFDGGQLVTILNDNSTLFGVSRVLGITSTNPAPLGTRLTEPVLDISSSGNIGIGATNVSNKVQINSINELVPSVVSSASSIGISTTIIGINTSGIAVGLEIQSFTGVIAAGTTVVSIGNTQIGIGRTTLNNFIRTNTVLTFGSRGNNDRVVAITSTGFVGLGVTNPQAKLEVQGTTRVTSVGSTAGEQIDIRHYRNIGYGTAVNNKGAVSFDGSNSYSGYLGNLLTFVNDNSGTLVSVNRYDSFPGIVTAFNIDYSGAINGFRNIKINGNVDFGGGAVSIARSEKFTFNVFRNPGVTTFRDSVTAIGSTYVPVNAVGGGIGGQLLTITNDNDAYSLQINRNVGVNSLTPVTTGNVIINPSLTVDKYGEVRIYETYPDVLSSTRIIGFQTGNVAIGDGDLFRIDAYSSPFIGSFPTINTALKVDKYGTFNFRRNINQTSGITTVGVATTSTTLSVNATLSFELLNNGTLSIKVRGTDGVTRTGIVTLS